MKTTFMARVTKANDLDLIWELEVNHLDLWYTDRRSSNIVMHEDLVGEIFQITIEDQVVTYMKPLSQLNQLPDGYYTFTSHAGCKQILEVLGDRGYVHGAQPLYLAKRALTLEDLEHIRRVYELTPLVPVPPMEER